MVMVIACPILAVLPEESRSSVRSLSNQSIIIPLPAAASMNSAVSSPDKNGQKPIIAASGAGGSPQKFTTRADQGWSIRWNPITDTPHLITGRALTLQGAKTLTKENIEPACLDFVAANANLLKVHPGQLRLANKVKAGGRWFVTFRQTYEGVPVLGGQLTASFTRDDRLITLASDIYPDIAVETKPKIDTKKAVRLALTDCGGEPDNCRLSDVQLCILPIHQPEGIDYILCWELYISLPMLHKK